VVINEARRAAAVEGLLEKEVGLPAFVKRSHHVSDERDMIRAHGLASEEHRGLIGSAISFPVIAVNASADKVLPCFFSPTGERHHMIERQGDVCPATILAPVAVPAEDVLAGKNDVLEGDPDVHGEPDDAREGHAHGNGTDLQTRMRLNQFRFAQVEKNDRFLRINEAHRLVVLIQYQNFGVELAVSGVWMNVGAEVSSTS
jgi:hypothetical protein